MTELKADVSVLKEDVSELKAGQVRLETRQDIMQTDLNRISGTVARLDGTDYEHRAAKMLPRFARIRLNLPRQTTLLHCDARNISINLPELDQALDSGTITPDQLENLQDADVIVAGSPLPEQPGFVLAESSITVQLEDVNRAAERADILRRATGRHVLSTVVGIDITDEAAQESQQRNVHFIRTDRDGRQIE